jgi:hypothetical protein
MTDPETFIPQIFDDDVEWICNDMGLRAFDQPRQNFLRSRSTLDVSACPGSGKTTLIVAKLALLARKWPHRTKGICVLSHTNAAHEEIQRRLRGTSVGQHLLSYPHFIGTIHGFVNQYLALPWLNSNGFPSATVDDDITSAYRRRIIMNSEYWKIENYLARKNSGFDRIRLKNRDFEINLGDGDFPAGPSAETHQIAKRAVMASANAGYFCYDEMFVWAKALLQDCPDVAKFLQHRFPLVIVDEMQDTSELQIGILDALFPRSSPAVVLQRVGDPNQAIYEGDRAGGAMPCGYPDPDNCLKIPNSFRFGPAIATLASPFAIYAAGPDGLQGVGPRVVKGAPDCCSNALFIFTDAEAHRVLDAYGHHVLSTFSDATLNIGEITAVGAVHQDASDVTASHNHFPKTVSHYCSGYTKEVGRSVPHPRTLIQYVRVAQALVRDGCDLAPGVEKIASGLIRLARRSGNTKLLSRSAPSHRTLLQAISPNAEAASAYRRLLLAYLVDWETLSINSWAQRQVDILQVVGDLVTPGSTIDAGDDFLSWDQQNASLVVTAPVSPQDPGPNVYRYDNGTGRIVDIRLGSVHSVKGQTHLATLLLSTYWHKHSSERILPWLLGEKINLNGAGIQDRARLHQTYVAMSRPSHLVCLAIPRSKLGNADMLLGRVEALKNRGWQVAEVVDGAPNWYS